MFVEDYDWDDSLPMPSGDKKDNKENKNNSLVDLDINNSLLSDSFNLDSISLANNIPLDEDKSEEKEPDFSSIFDDYKMDIGSSVITGVSDAGVSLESNVDSSIKLEGGIDLNDGELNTWSVDLDIDYAKDDELEDHTVLSDDESIHNSDVDLESIEVIDDSLYDYSDESLNTDKLTSYHNPNDVLVVAQYEKPIDKYDIILVAGAMFTSFVLLSVSLLTLDILVCMACPPGRNCHRPLLEAVRQTLGL